MDLPYKPDDVVKTCSRIESGLRLAYDGVRACTFSTGAMEAPDYWSATEVPPELTKEMLIEKRKDLFLKLNDETSDILCKKCLHWEEKKFSEVSFDKLEFVNVAHFSACNLRCNYCGFTKENHFFKEKYSALNILNVFAPEDVTFESSVDFNAGEPTLMKDLEEHLEFFRSRKMRVRLYSNGVVYSQAVYDAVLDGTITWLIISVDAGTPGTYKDTKKADAYREVIRNLAKYREAEHLGKGKVAAKYIFTESTLRDDDITGFVYSMMAIGMQNIWMLFDYFLFHSDDVADKQKYIDAYTKMYLLFEEWGITPSHFSEGAAAAVLEVARNILDDTKANIDKVRFEKKQKSPRRNVPFDVQIYHEPPIPRVSVDRELSRSEIIRFARNNKNVAIVPAGIATIDLLKEMDEQARSNILCLGDLSISKHGRLLEGVEVKSYQDLAKAPYETIIVMNRYFSDAILNDISKSGGLAGKQIIRISE